MPKRERSRSPPSWRDGRGAKSPRSNPPVAAHFAAPEHREGGRDTFARSQARKNQTQENEHMRQWVNQEDEFVLQQSLKKAKIRVREGRAKPIDQLAVCLSILDPGADLLEEADTRPDFEIQEPVRVVDAVDEDDLADLTKEIDRWLVLESRRVNRNFWKAAKRICDDRLSRMSASKRNGRGLDSVAADIDKVLAPKTLEQLIVLERTVKQKLDSNEPIDEDYWEQLLASIGIYKAKADLSQIFGRILSTLWDTHRLHNVAEAEHLQRQFEVNMRARGPPTATTAIHHSELQLKVLPEDKNLQTTDEDQFLQSISEHRKNVRGRPPPLPGYEALNQTALPTSSGRDPERPLLAGSIDGSLATDALYNREAARGVGEDEEVFAAEEDVSSSKRLANSGDHLRKPRYFNRVQMGYEWNKYNQTHYDYDNPPPKVVQGYKFNIFYPELVDKSKAPTYRIERENGRKRGQSFAPAGEEDTCLIRFISGAPYEDIAFRIVDREWDYSAKRERGFKSRFERGILQLHFHFKKIYYRK